MSDIDNTNFNFSGNPEYINVFNDEQSSSMDSIVFGGPSLTGGTSCTAPSAGCPFDYGGDIGEICPPVSVCLTDCPSDGGPCAGGDCTNCSEYCSSDDCFDNILPGACAINPTGFTSDICSCRFDNQPSNGDSLICVGDGGGCLDTPTGIIYYAVGIKFQISGHTETTTTDVHRITGTAGITFNNWISSPPCYVFADDGTYPLTRYSNGVYYVTKFGQDTHPVNFIVTTTAGTTGYQCKVTLNVNGYNNLTVTANTFYYANETPNYQDASSITAKTAYTTANVKMNNMQLSVANNPAIPSPIKFEISKSNGTNYYAYSLQYGTSPYTAYIKIYSSSYTGSIYVRSVGVGGTTYGYTFPSTQQKITFNNGASTPISSSYYPVIDTSKPVIATLSLLTQIYPNLGQSSNNLCLSKDSYGSGPELILSGSVTNDYQLWRLAEVMRPASPALANQLWGNAYNTKIII